MSGIKFLNKALSLLLVSIFIFTSNVYAQMHTLRLPLKYEADTSEKKRSGDLVGNLSGGMGIAFKSLRAREVEPGKKVFETEDTISEVTYNNKTGAWIIRINSTWGDNKDKENIYFEYVPDKKQVLVQYYKQEQKNRNFIQTIKFPKSDRADAVLVFNNIEKDPLVALKRGRKVGLDITFDANFTHNLSIEDFPAWASYEDWSIKKPLAKVARQPKTQGVFGDPPMNLLGRGTENARTRAKKIESQRRKLRESL